jgi:8-oxo-dGTP diphosphatase
MREFTSLYADDGRRIVAAAAIFRRNDTGQWALLSARRTEPEEFAGGWELPGGKIDEGETIEQAVIREIAEELGVHIVLGDLVPGPDLHQGWPLGEYGVMIVHTAFLADADAVPAPIEQHDSVIWLTREDLDNVPWLPADRAPAVAAFDAAAHG